MNATVFSTASAVLLGLGLSSAIAQDVRSDRTEAKVIYSQARQDCSRLNGRALTQCLADVKGNYMSSEMRCEAVMGPAKEACLKQAEAAEARQIVSRAASYSTGRSDID